MSSIPRTYGGDPGAVAGLIVSAAYSPYMQGDSAYLFDGNFFPATGNPYFNKDSSHP